LLESNIENIIRLNKRFSLSSAKN